MPAKSKVERLLASRGFTFLRSGGRHPIYTNKNGMLLTVGSNPEIWASPKWLDKIIEHHRLRGNGVTKDYRQVMEDALRLGEGDAAIKHGYKNSESMRSAMRSGLSRDEYQSYRQRAATLHDQKQQTVPVWADTERQQATAEPSEAFANQDNASPDYHTVPINPYSLNGLDHTETHDDEDRAREEHWQTIDSLSEEPETLLVKADDLNALEVAFDALVTRNQELTEYNKLLEDELETFKQAPGSLVIQRLLAKLHT